MFNKFDCNNSLLHRVAFLLFLCTRFLPYVMILCSFYVIVYRRYVTQRQNTILFNIKCTCILKMANQALLLLLLLLLFTQVCSMSCIMG